VTVIWDRHKDLSREPTLAKQRQQRLVQSLSTLYGCYDNGEPFVTHWNRLSRFTNRNI